MKKHLSVLAAVLAAAVPFASAVERHKADNATTLSTASSWVGTVVPVSTDVAVWASTVATVTSCSNNPGADHTWLGIKIANPVSAITLTNGTTLRTLTLRGAGIDLGSASNTQSLWVGPQLIAATAQTWSVGSGRTLTLWSNGHNTPSAILHGNVTITGGGTTVYRRVIDVNSNATLTIDSGVTLSANANADTIIRLGFTNKLGANLTVNGGTVIIGRTSTSDGTLTVGHGDSNTTVSVLNLNGGLIEDRSTDTAKYVALGQGTASTGILNMAGGEMRLMRLQVGRGGYGQLNLTNGFISVTNSFFLPQGSASGTVNLVGGTLAVPAVVKNGGGTSTFNFDGGTLQARSNSTAFISAATVVNVKDGGAVIDSAGLSITVLAPLLNAGSGGLTKLGAGTLSLTATNTYGGATAVKQGKLSLYASGHSGGSIGVSNGTVLGVSLVGPDTLRASAVILGETADGLTTNDINVGGFGGLAVPVLHATNLTVNGTNVVNLSGVGLSVGQFPLITYGSASGLTDSSFTNGTLPAGVSAYLTNNTANSSIDLVVTAVPNLVWTAKTDTNWDTTTTNWLDAVTSNDAAFFTGAIAIFDDSALTQSVDVASVVQPAAAIFNNVLSNYTLAGAGAIGGAGALILSGGGQVTLGLTNNSYAAGTLISNGTLVLAATNVLPDGAGKGNALINGVLSLDGHNEEVNGLTGSGVITNGAPGTNNTFTVGRNNANSLFSGTFADEPTVSAVLAVTKTNTGTLTLLGASSFHGIFAGQGRVELGHNQAIGLGGPAEINSCTLASYGGARELTNSILLRGGNGVRNTFDTTAGDLTLWGAVAGVSNANTRDAAKVGPNALRLGSSASVWLAQEEGLDIVEGEVVVDGASCTNSGDGVRLAATNGGLAQLVITNGGSWVIGTGIDTASLTLGNTANNAGTNVMRLADGVVALGASGQHLAFGNGANTTNVVVQTGGLLTFADSTVADSGVRFANAAGARAEYWLSGGILATPHIFQGSAAGFGYFRFDGGVLQPVGVTTYAATFMAGLTEATVENGGAVIDTAGRNLTIGQSLLAGGTGGLAKNGLGTLTLTGTNTYTGPTTVNTGRLNVTPAVFAGGGAITVSDGATLGVSLAASGTSLSASGLTLGSSGSSTLDLSLGAFGNPSAPVIAASSLAANGTATIHVRSAAPLALGTITLIDFSGDIGGGGFASLALGTLPPGVQGVLVSNGANSSVDLDITNIADFVWTGAQDGNWDIDATTNWTLLGSDAAYADGGPARFDNTVVGPVSVVLATAVSPAGVTVSSDSNYTFAGSGKISGAGGIAKDGSGTLAVNTTNDFTGAVTVSGGTLIAGHSNALGAASGGTVISGGGTLDVNAQALNREPITVSGDGVGGAGALVNNGAADQQNAARFVTLAGNATLGGSRRWDVRGTAGQTNAVLSTGGQPYNLTKVGSNFVSLVYAQVDPALGDIEVQGGGLGYEVTTTSLGDPSKTLTVRSNAYVQMYQNSNPLDKQVTLENTAQIRAASGTSNVVTGPVTLDSGLGQLSVAASSSLVLSNTVAGAGGLRKINPGTAVLAAANYFAGATVVEAGILEVSADANLGTPPGAATPGHLTITGGTLRATAGFTLDANRGLALGTDPGTGTATVDVVAGTLDYGGIAANNGAGAGAVLKLGAGTLKLGGSNTYSGGTTVSNGTIQVGSDLALGAGRLTLSGGALSSDGAAARTLSNDFTIATATTLGDAVNNGALTLAGSGNFNGAGRTLTMASDVVFAGLTTNGYMGTKNGPGTLTLKGVNLWSGNTEIRDGVVVIDGGAVTNANAFRPTCNLPGGTARMVITNGGSFTMTAAGNNQRVGNAADTTATNVLEIAGSIRMPTADASNGRLLIANGCALAVANLWPGGDLEVNYVDDDGGVGPISELNFRGGVLRAQRANADFIRRLDFANVRDGGAIFDTQGFDITVAQPLLNGGSGGLEKRGAGTLTLASNNTYLGWTTIAGGTLALSNNGSVAVSAGIDVQAGATCDVAAVAGGFTLGAAQTLKGYGTVVGTVTNAGLLTPGSSIGTLSFANDLALDAAGTTVLEIQSPSNDQAAVAGTVTYGGTLTVTNLGGALTTNDSFTLFTAAGFSGWFASLSLPAVPEDTAWDTNKLQTTGILDVYEFSFSTQTLAAGKNTPAELPIFKLLQKAVSSRGTVTLASVNTNSAMTGTVAVVGTNIVYTPPTNYVGGDTFTCVLADGHGTITATVDVTVTNTDNVSGNILPLSLSGGNVLVRFMGIPGTNYILQSATNIVTPPVTWQSRVTNTAPTNGLMSFLDTTSTNIYLQYYRTIVP